MNEETKRKNGRNQHWSMFAGGKQAVFQPGDRGDGQDQALGIDSH